ncbi:hypothetical protein N7493_011865 [Penicillium malachiteum]|uniref:Uncharacterized protein n=1 Tax=Penicillium malachiteum TaxID=1324776 RepID=A0AAD6MQ89_9EURO|nr:hypothetical protein N7493_011865 [Penicillium malachiteum]
MAPKYELAMPDGRSLTWIFDHCLRFPTTYEIPMAVMFKINSHPNEPTLYQDFAHIPRYVPPTETVVETIARRNAGIKRASSDSKSTIDPDLGADDFRTYMIYSISHLPSQPCTILPSLLVSYIRRTFVSDVEKIDFPHAMYAIDYLRDLDLRYKKEFHKALQTLHITREDVVDPITSSLSRRFPGNMAWVEKMYLVSRDLESLYTQLYLGLRRWTMVNAIMLDTKDKANHIAMLNSLFPPANENTFIPTSLMNHVSLRGHRERLFQYINLAYKDGIDALNSAVYEGARPGYRTVWIDTWEILDRYLVMVSQTIDDCLLITDPPVQEETGSRKGRKVDSGISFGSGSLYLPSDFAGDKPLPNFPLPPVENSKPLGSSLERLGKEIKRMGLGGKSLKKMKSMSALTMRPRSQHSQKSQPSMPPTPSKNIYDASFFEIDDEKRRRLVAEALRRKKPRTSSTNEKK